MDNNDNLKSPTGGLKLMTVFIAVLALHVVVIGGFTVYHLMSGGSTDTDVSATDKSHKSTSDITTAEVTQTDKSTAPTEVATIASTTVTPSSAPAPAADTTSPAISTTATPVPESIASTTSVPVPATAPTIAPAATPALTLSPMSPVPAATPATVTPTIARTPTAQTPSGPIQPDLAPPPDAAPVAISPMAPVIAPTAPLAAGPVHMPPANADASLIHHAHQQTYIVKITDSYKKIAKAHHVTVAQLKEANHIKGDVLHTGQKLIIPSNSEKTELAETAPTATSTLSSAPTTTVSSLSTAPMTTGLTSTTTTESTVEHHHMYTIVKGDTLTKIAHKFKTTPSAIMAANSNIDPAKLTIGKKLRIPSRESRSASITPRVATPPAQVQQAKSATAPATGQLANFAQ